MRTELESLLGLQRSGDMKFELTSTRVGCQQATEPQKKNTVVLSLLAFLSTTTKNRITSTNSNGARNDMVIINLSMLHLPPIN
jgi:hypothetical protein